MFQRKKKVMEEKHYIKRNNKNFPKAENGILRKKGTTRY